MGIPRMRTARGVVDLIRAEDPETGITEYHVRKIIKSGKVNVVTSGKKMLVDADKIIEVLAGGCDV